MKEFLQSLSKKQVAEMIALYKDYLQSHQKTEDPDREEIPWNWKTEHVQKLLKDAEQRNSRGDWVSVVNSLPTTIMKRPDATPEQIKKMLQIWSEEISGLDDVKNTLLGYSLQYFRGGNIPLLIFYGPPGTGKTTVARVFANMLSRPFFSVDCPQVSEGEAVGGNRPEYNCARPGAIISATIETGTGNPVIGWDEFDKAIARHTSIGDSLLSLTDNISSVSFRDNFLGFPTDVSQIWHILLCNELNTISPALMSRANVIEFPKPTKECLFEIIKRFIIQIAKNYPHIEVNPAELAGNLVEVDLETTRDYRKPLENAFGCADLKFLSEGISTRISIDDILKYIPKKNNKRALGF